MKIPIIQSETKVPSTTYPVEPSGLLAQAATGQRVQGLINTIVEEQGRILEKQKAINQATEISQAEIDVENENQKLIENLKRSPNPEKYYSDWQAGYQNISRGRLSQIKDPETKAKAQITFQKMMAQNMVQQSHYGNMLWLSTKRGQIARLGDEYIKNGQPEKAIALVENGIVGGLFTPEEGEKEIIGIKDKAEKKVKDDNYANALNMIITDPSEETLNKSIQLFDIPTERQAELRRQQRIERDAQERQTKEIEDIARKKEDGEIATEYLKKNYSEVYRRVSDPKSLLTSERRTFWGDHAEIAARRKEEVEPGEEATEISYINQIRAKGVNPEVIKDYIITTPRLNEPERKRQIEKQEIIREREINRGLRISNDYLKKEIVSPKGIAGVMAKSIPEDVRAVNFTNAQIALEEWIDKQVILEKPIGASDIQKKAEELVNIYRPKINQRSPIIQKNTTDMIKSLSELGEISKNRMTETEPITGKGIEVPTKEGKPKQTKYKTIEEVRNAYNRKELTYAEADNILKGQFGVK